MAAPSGNRSSVRKNQKKPQKRQLSVLQRCLPLMVLPSPLSAPTWVQRSTAGVWRRSSSTSTSDGSFKHLLRCMINLFPHSTGNVTTRTLTLSLCVLAIAGAVSYLLRCWGSLEPTSTYTLTLSGPGLSPQFTLPVRYIYVTVTPSYPDGNGSSSWLSTWCQKIYSLLSSPRGTPAHSRTASPIGNSQHLLHFQLASSQWNVTWRLMPSNPRMLTGRRLAVSSIVDRGGGGVYILRFRLLQSVPQGYTLEATISHSGKTGSKNVDDKNPDTQSSASTAQVHVVPQTFTLKGPVYVPSSCPCPARDGNDGWLEALQCPESFTQLTADISSFPVVDLHRLREESRKLVGSQSLRTVVHYVIKNNQVYRRSLGPLPSFQYFSDAIFRYLTSVVTLPDVEFVINLGDWPIQSRQSGVEALPLFGWSGGEHYAGIVLPQWDVVKTTIFGLDGEKGEDLLTVQGNTDRPLEDRIPKAVFRGRDSNPIRVEVVRLARKFPSLIDAEITSWEKEQNIAAQKELDGGSRMRLPLTAFANYKYQLLLDGTVAAYRTPYLLHSGSVPLKQESEYYEWFYSDLQPMVNFVPFKADLSDLLERLEWAEAHPNEAATIAESAQSYARENLLPEKVVCYYYRALTAYAQRQNTEPRVDPDMLRIEQDPRDPGCACPPHKEQLSQLFGREGDEGYPIVAVNPNNVKEILHGTNKGIVLVAFSSFCNRSGLYMPKFLKVARLFSEKKAPLVFAAADGYRYHFPSAYNFCNFPGAQPQVMFLSLSGDDAKNKVAKDDNTKRGPPEYMKDSLTVYNTVNFVNKYLPQTKYHVEVPEDPLDEMSQPLPTDNDQKLVKTVVGANFDNLVLHARKDVLLFVHAPWCGLCKRFKPIYEDFAKVVQASHLENTLMLTSMDGSENRLRHKEFLWSSYPVLWHVRGIGSAERKQPTQFRGPWTFAGLLMFVQAHVKGGAHLVP